MGKKKSAALIVLFTVVLVGLVFMSVASFPVSAVYNYNSLLSMIDLSTDLGGGYTAVYYPEGVISQEEYNALAADYEDKKDEADAPENPKDLYHQYGGVYIENESWNSDEEDVTEAFRNEFDSAFRALQNRFEQKSYSAYSIKLQDGYTIRVDVPYTDEDVTTMFDTMAYSGRLYFSDSDDTVSLASKNILMEGTSQYIREAGATAYGDGYASYIRFTSEGQSEFASITGSLAESSSSSSDSSSSSSSATLYIYMGENILTSATVSGALDQNTVFIYNSNSPMTQGEAETLAAVINSALIDENVFDINLDASRIATFEPTLGVNAALIAAIVFGALIVAMLIVSLIRFKGMGLAHLYGFLTYAVVFVLCLAFIDAVQLSVAGVIAIALSAAVMVFFNWYAFKNIREEFASGKTLTASVKAGYKKSLAFTIDAHIVLLLLSAALCLISTGTMFYAGLILVLGTVISAACTLAVTRFCLYVFLAQPKNKIAFCNLKREETEDE